jgi:hypothetical protein
MRLKFDGTVEPGEMIRKCRSLRSARQSVFLVVESLSTEIRLFDNVPVDQSDATDACPSQEFR